MVATDLDTITYGISDSNYVSGSLIGVTPYLKVQYNTINGSIEINTNLIGDYNLANVMSAVCVGRYFNVFDDKIKIAIAEAKIVDTSRLSTDAVQIMSKEEMTNMATKSKMTYSIVSESEANLKLGKISIKTPIAQGLLNHKVGDVVEVKIPRGVIKLRIDKISID